MMGRRYSGVNSLRARPAGRCGEHASCAPAPRTAAAAATGASLLPKRALAGHDIIVIGASAGGVEAVSRVVADLPRDLAAAVFVVVHIPPDATSVLPGILSRRGPLPAAHARDGEAIEPGRIYVAAPDRHLLIKPGRVLCTRGPRENATRPSVDPLFRTAAQAYGARVLAVVLSGTLDDGTVGLAAVKRRGGVALVQDPADATYPGMPASAVQNVAVDAVLPLDGMAAEIVRWVGREVSGSEPPTESQVAYEIDVAEMDPAAVLSRSWVGDPTDLTCPECRGALLEMGSGHSLHFRCRVGHSYSPATLYSQQAAAVEAAIWSALQILEERCSLATRMAERMERRGQPRIATRYTDQAAEAHRHAQVLRRVLLEGDEPPVDAPDAAPPGSRGAAPVREEPA
jgi:two-component system chemotaxis response regulator CheB